MMKKMNEVFNEIYFDPSHPASFGSAYSLYKAAKVVRVDLSGPAFAHIKGRDLLPMRSTRPQPALTSLLS